MPNDVEPDYAAIAATLTAGLLANPTCKIEGATGDAATGEGVAAAAVKLYFQVRTAIAHAKLAGAGGLNK